MDSRQEILRDVGIAAGSSPKILASIAPLIIAFPRGTATAAMSTFGLIENATGEFSNLFQFYLSSYT